MKASLMILALSASVLFNVFFLAGYLHARYQAAQRQSHEAVSQLVARELDLDTTQSELYSQLRHHGREDARLYEESIALVRRELVDAVASDDPDFDRLREIIARESELRHQWKLMDAGRFHDFMTSLKPDQRRQFCRRMEGGDKDKRHAHMLRRFDANQDGTLDEQERQAAREHIQARRSERERRWRQRMQEHFDVNGDGRIDGDERARAEEQMRRDARERRMRLQLLKRFDADQDGRLNEAETAQMVAWLQQE